MKKLVYFLKDDYSVEYCLGIYNKVFGQLKAFAEYDIEPILLFINGTDLVIKNLQDSSDQVVYTFKNTLHKKLFIYKILFTQIQKINPDYFYIRYPFSDPFFIKMLKKLQNLDIKTAIEFPTYPYDTEAKGLKTKILLFIDKIFRNKLYKYVDFAVSYTKFDRIYNIRTLFINNGIDIDTIKISERTGLSNEIYLIGVANVSFWHGYDRVIEGIKNYTGKYHIVFHIVGDGEEIYNLKKLVKLYNLEKNVVFHGSKVGKDLDEVFDVADVAIASLGAHRKGLFADSALKNREYCARGVPFVISSDDFDFQDFKYIMKIAKDDTPLNMEYLLNFYENISKERNYKKKMRKFAEKNLTWKSQLADVIDEFKEVEYI